MTQSQHSNHNNGTIITTKVNNNTAKCNSNDCKTRVIRLYRNGNSSLGFSIRGGWEHGTGIYVSEVHEGSEADKQGLQRGDEIISINGFSLSHAIHEEVISLVKSSSKVILKVKSTGIIPVKDTISDVLTWKLIDSQSSASASPCPSLSGGSSPEWTASSSHSHSDSESDHLEAKIFIDLSDQKSLGCSVVKGPGHGHHHGIFVQNVKSGGIADQSGLQVGDQIVDCNGINFNNIDFCDAIAQLKSSSTMTVTVRKGAGGHLFGIGPGGGHHSHRYNGSEKKQVTAVIHHHHQNRRNGHLRMLSHGSNSSSSSSVGTGISRNGHDVSDNDYSICEIETCDSGPSIDPRTIMEKVKKEEERLAIERKKLETDQMRLKKEMQKLEMEKKELDRLKNVSEECQSLSNCSLSSASAASSTGSGASAGSQSISFLEEIKMIGEKRNLRPVNRPETKNHINGTLSDDNKGTNNGKKLRSINGDNELHKQHELLMEEFRRAHRRMFGNGSSQESPSTKESPKECPQTEPSPSFSSSNSNLKSPPPVPVKNKGQSAPIVTIGTYQQSNNRFAPNAQNHRSVIHVKRDDSNDANPLTLSPLQSQSSPPITIRVISTTRQY